MTTTRLFLALEIPPEVKESLASICYGIHKVRWVKPEQFHCTVRFLGELPTPVIDDIVNLLESVEQRRILTSVTGVALFLNRNGSKTLHAVMQDDHWTKSLSQTISKTLSPLSLPANQKKIVPHITLARLKDISHKNIQNYLEQFHNFSTSGFEINRMTLFASDLHPDGAVYHGIHTIEFV